ncbi:hypothetical protein D3C81_237310 [compost metagenome]
MSVVKIFGFEDLAPTINTALFENFTGLARVFPDTQSFTMAQYKGRQWAKVQGSLDGNGGYSVTRAASFKIEMIPLVTAPVLLSKRIWVGCRVLIQVTANSYPQSMAWMEFGLGGNVPLLGFNELLKDVEYYIEIGFDYTAGNVQVWVNGALFKTVLIPAWGPQQASGYTRVIIGQFDQDYNNNGPLLGQARMFLFNDVYVTIEDGIGLSGRLGAVKVKPLEIEEVTLGEGWGQVGVGTPKEILSAANLTPTTTVANVLRSSTKHTDTVVGFKKPVTEDPVEFVQIDAIGFRDEATTTNIVTSVDDRGVKTPNKLTVSPVATVVGGQTRVLSSEMTPTGDRWSPDIVDSLKVILNAKTGA